MGKKYMFGFIKPQRKVEFKRFSLLFKFFINTLLANWSIINILKVISKT